MCGYVARYFCAPAKRVPTDVKFPVERLMMPKYDKLVSEKIMPGMTKTELVMMVPSELGKMCLNMILQSDAPNVLAARTYS